MEQFKPEKNALPVQRLTRTGESNIESKSGQKEVSPFCEFCEPVKTEPALDDPLVFTDRYGFSWRCLNPSCHHAIRIGASVEDCMILNRILTRKPGSLQDVIDPKSNSRRKNRVTLDRERKIITGFAAVV